MRIHRIGDGTRDQKVSEFKRKKKTQGTSCNLCKRHFSVKSKFERFCPNCKLSSQLFQFHEWMGYST